MLREEVADHLLRSVGRAGIDDENVVDKRQRAFEAAADDRGLVLDDHAQADGLGLCGLACYGGPFWRRPGVRRRRCLAYNGRRFWRRSAVRRRRFKIVFARLLNRLIDEGSGARRQLCWIAELAQHLDSHACVLADFVPVHGTAVELDSARPFEITNIGEGNRQPGVLPDGPFDLGAIARVAPHPCCVGGEVGAQLRMQIKVDAHAHEQRKHTGFREQLQAAHLVFVARKVRVTAVPPQRRSFRVLAGARVARELKALLDEPLKVGIVVPEDRVEDTAIEGPAALDLLVPEV